MVKFSKTFYLLTGVMTVLSLTTLVLIFNKTQQKTAELKTYALYGGSTEKGYPFTGFLITKGADGNWKTCSGFFVNSVTMYTAKHCVDDILFGYGGQGSFTFSLQKLTRIKEINTIQNSTSLDIAQVIFQKPVTAGPFAQIDNLSTSDCGYTVVAYGYSEEEPTLPGIKKSAAFCIIRQDQPFIFLKSNTGGVCFGDSGSPIVKTGTNQVVGISVQLDAAQCSPGTTLIGLSLNTNILNKTLLQTTNISDSLYTALESKYTTIPIAKVTILGEASALPSSSPPSFLTSFVQHTKELFQIK